MYCLVAGKIFILYFMRIVVAHPKTYFKTVLITEFVVLKKQ